MNTSCNILADRLERLTRSGLITPHRLELDARQIAYRPTQACRKLWPVLVEMAYWGAVHAAKTAAAAAFRQAYEKHRVALLRSMRKA